MAVHNEHIIGQTMNNVDRIDKIKMTRMQLTDSRKPFKQKGKNLYSVDDLFL